LKACDRHNPGHDGRPTPGWLAHRWFEDLLELKPLTAAQATFCLVVSGFVVYEVFTEWSVTKELLLWTPTRLEQILGTSGIWSPGIVKSTTLFVVLPSVFWLLPFSTFRLVGGRLSLSDYALRFGIAFIPIMAAAHTVKALLKMTSRIPYWEYVASDPVGVETARGILDQTVMLAPLPFWRDPAITILGLGLMAVAIALNALVLRKLIAIHTSESGWRCAPLYLIPLLYGGAFVTMLIAWRLF